MKDALTELLRSKRFIVTVLAVTIVTVLCATGRIAVSDYATKLTQLFGLLATLYGLENAATALNPNKKDGDR